jgi:hypothetical protein
MKKSHAAAVALLLGIAAVFGTLAASRTAGLGRTAAARPSATRSVLAGRSHQLDQIEVALRKSLRRRPPKLPPVPKVQASPPVQVAGAPDAAPQRVIYQRPPPIVIVKHHSRGDDGKRGDGGDGGGGGDD